jgi:cation transport protein ChaC
MTKHPAIWIFGYGSLMWDPGFPFTERATALLHGFHRAFCVYSRRYRGTPERPGLVLGLQPGGSCRGIAYRIAESHRDEAHAYLKEREMTNSVYEERHLPVLLGDGRRVHAQAYVVDRKHPQYTGRLTLEKVAELICQGVGDRGPCAEYLINTVRHLDELGIKDGPMHELLRWVEARRTGEVWP